MEEKKPLESRSLSHTSKEPEAQAWAQIGTSSYDPPKAEEAAAADEKKLNNGDQKGASSNATTEQAATSATGSAEREAGADLELHVDPNSEPIQSEGEKAENATKKESSDGKKRNVLSDGFGNGKDETRRSRSRSKERDRSRSRERRVYDDRTNSKDPKFIRARVFVGHLNTDECTREDVEKLFSPHGRIIGVNLQNGYGFVQYEDEASAKTAIKELHETTFFNTKLGMQDYSN